MNASRYVDLILAFAKLKTNDFTDLVDKLYSKVSVLLLGLFAITVTLKHHYFAPIACQLSTSAAMSSGLVDYVEHYCLGNGVVPLNLTGNRGIPQIRSDWIELEKSKKTEIYWYIPWILLLQMALFFFPNRIYIAWFNYRCGIDMKDYVMKECTKILFATTEVSKAATQLCINENLNKILIRLNIRQLHKSNTFIRSFINNLFGLPVIYFLFKITNFSVIIIQLYIIEKYTGIGIDLLLNGQFNCLYNKFPVESLCNVPIHSLVSSNQIIAQCVLTLNIFNRYILLLTYFWFIFVILASIFSISRWCHKYFSQSERFRKLISKTNNSSNLTDVIKEIDGTENELVKLNRDMMFILDMIGNNSDEILKEETLNYLIKDYKWKN